jgi:hypothetical protein
MSFTWHKAGELLDELKFSPSNLGQLCIFDSVIPSQPCNSVQISAAACAGFGIIAVEHSKRLTFFDQ